ncbi:ATP-binding cassette domain-containing protein [Synechococcus sp. MIT S9452]|uniref:ATP-binding cassette domain-containing protein n=1 Tax=Synechococcus sp. MIT S9452 TaxID=3082546 RepID=UPI0039A6EF5E
MKLAAGEVIDWPLHPFVCDGSDIFTIVNGTSVFRLKEDLLLPGFTEEVGKELQLQLRATQSVNVILYEEATEKVNRAWLVKQLYLSLEKAAIADDYGDEQEVQLFRELRDKIADKDNASIQSYTPINKSTESQLFCWLESKEKAVQQQKQIFEHGTNQDHALKSCLAEVLSCSVSDVKAVGIRSNDPRQRLQQMLDQNDLIGREVVINSQNLNKECGDLIAFNQEEDNSPVLLKTNNDGYRLWDPKSNNKPSPIKNSESELEQLSQRMIGITPALKKKDLTTVGLWHFTFGKSESFIQFVSAGLLVGAAIGFMLSIGREVGAARWIFSMATTGTILGGALGLVTGGLRSGTAAMLIVTLLGMLTPAFNTVITNQALPDQDLGLLLQISVVLLAAGLTSIGLEWVQSRDILISQQKGAAKMQLASMKRALDLPTEFYRQRGVGELQSRLGAIDEIREEIQDLLGGGIVESLLISLYILFMLRISVKLTLLAVFVSFLMLIPTIIVAIQSRPLQRHQEKEEADAEGRNLELINSVSKLRLAGAEAAAARWWAQPYKRVVNLETALDVKGAVSDLLEDVIPNLGTLLLYIVVTKLIAEAAATPRISAPNIGQLLGFFSAFGTFIGGISGLTGLISEAFELPIYYERAKPFFDSDTESQSDQLESLEITGDIELDRVSYRYDDELPLVLDSVSFHIKQGEYVAIVGPSGSGKSTLIRLLLGFDSPEDGSVRFDGRPISGLNLKSLRKQIGTVLQSSTLFSGSLMEAIAGGTFLQEEDVWEAVEQAGLAEDIRKMPMGLQTVLPDGGGTLSGGQRQRVAIARALARKPRLLIFDEATSALDNRTQAIVTKSLDKLPMTRIMIAHRLSTIRKADRIIVIENGQLIEEGNYEALMSNNGLFTRLMKQQIK